MAKQINLGERLIRLADRVLSSNTSETLGYTGGITNNTATDTSVPTTKAVKEYVDAHEHGQIKNNGSIGTVANKPIITTTNGILTTGTFGTNANTFAEGNHLHPQYVHPTQSAITGVPTTNQTPSFGETFVIPQSIIDTLGHTTTINTRNVTIPNLPNATTTNRGVVQLDDSLPLKQNVWFTYTSENPVQAQTLYDALHWHKLRDWGQTGNASIGISLYYNDLFVVIKFQNGADYSGITTSFTTIYGNNQNERIPEEFRPLHTIGALLYSDKEIVIWGQDEGGESGKIRGRALQSNGNSVIKGYIIYPRLYDE